MNPKRIQCKRTKGWRKPTGAVLVGRPTKWGNPFRGLPSSVDDFRRELLKKSPAELEQLLAPLRGKILMCWCKVGEPCHADVLLELANAQERS